MYFGHSHCCCGSRRWTNLDDRELGAIDRATFSYVEELKGRLARISRSRQDGGEQPLTIAVFDTVDTAEQGDLIARHTIIEDIVNDNSDPRTAEDFFSANAHLVGDLDADGYLDPAFGHGSFITDIISRVMPDAAVVQESVATTQGLTTDATVARVLEDFYMRMSDEGRPPGIVNLSLGVYTINDEPPAAVHTVIKEMAKAGWLFVASAGNDTTCRPSYPAALPEVVGVGAVGPYGPAWFSNFGDWVDACAPGVEILGVLPDPTTTLVGAAAESKGESEDPVIGSIGLNKNDGEPAQEGDQTVSWSGTSFAAPAVVGAIARAAQQIKEQSAVTAWSEALAEAKFDVVDEPTLLRWPGLGTVVNVSPSYDPDNGPYPERAI